MGEKLPSERQIAAEYGISRITARKALALLRQEGYVHAFQGKGAFVSQSTARSYIHAPAEGFSGLVRASGMVPTSKVLSCGIVPVSGDIAQGLDVREFAKAIKLRRLRLADGVPVALDTAYLSYPLCSPVLQANLEKDSLYSLLEQSLGIRLGYSDQTFQSILVNDGDVQLLRLSPPTTVVRVKRQTYDTHGRVIEYVEAMYHGSVFNLKAFARLRSD